MKPGKEEEAAYQVALEAAMEHAIEESTRDKEACSEGLEEALALTATDDWVLPPPTPAAPVLPEPKIEEEDPLKERYEWTSQLRKWVSASAFVIALRWSRRGPTSCIESRDI